MDKIFESNDEIEYVNSFYRYFEALGFEINSLNKVEGFFDSCPDEAKPFQTTGLSEDTAGENNSVSAQYLIEPSLLGAYLCTENKILLCLDKLDTDDQIKVVAAHELAHWLVAKVCIKDSPALGCNIFTDYNIEEDVTKFHEFWAGVLSYIFIKDVHSYLEPTFFDLLDKSPSVYTEGFELLLNYSMGEGTVNLNNINWLILFKNSRQCGLSCKLPLLVLLKDLKFLYFKEDALKTWINKMYTSPKDKQDFFSRITEYWKITEAVGDNSCPHDELLLDLCKYYEKSKISDYEDDVKGELKDSLSS